MVILNHVIIVTRTIIIIVGCLYRQNYCTNRVFYLKICRKAVLLDKDDKGSWLCNSSIITDLENSNGYFVTVVVLISINYNLKGQYSITWYAISCMKICPPTPECMICSSF
jgi:hypothetical protein